MACVSPQSLTAILRDCEFLGKSYSRFAIKIILAESPRLRSSQPRKAATVSGNCKKNDGNNKINHRRQRNFD